MDHHGKRRRYRAASLLRALGLLLLGGCASSTIIDQPGPIAQGVRERCDNQLDDDGDGQVDLEDADCTSAPDEGALLEVPFEVCGESEGDRGHYPVDMIWVLDGSRSMQDERLAVLSNLATMASVLEEKRSNVRIVVIGGQRGDFCVKPPLGGPGCTDGERYRLVDDQDPQDLTGNSNMLDRVLDWYPRYRDFLRAESRRVLVLVSDDNPAVGPSEKWPDGLTPRAFDAKLKALDAGFDDYIFHSIVAFSAAGGNHPRGCRGAVALGKTYLELTAHTRGLKFSVCNEAADDWEAFFRDVAESVAGLVNVPCVYPLTVTYEAGKATSPDQVFVVAEVEGRQQPLDRFPGADACGDALGYYAQGDSLQVCPAVCASPSISSIKVSHGCPGPEGPH